METVATITTQPKPHRRQLKWKTWKSLRVIVCDSHRCMSLFPIETVSFWTGRHCRREITTCPIQLDAFCFSTWIHIKNIRLHSNPPSAQLQAEKKSRLRLIADWWNSIINLKTIWFKALHESKVYPFWSIFLFYTNVIRLRIKFVIKAAQNTD